MEVKTMSEIAITKVTRKFQITVPKYSRDICSIAEGDYLAVIPNGDELILKKIDIPTWDEIFKKGTKSARRKKITQKKVLNAIQKERRAA